MKRGEVLGLLFGVFSAVTVQSTDANMLLWMRFLVLVHPVSQCVAQVGGQAELFQQSDRYPVIGFIEGAVGERHVVQAQLAVFLLNGHPERPLFLFQDQRCCPAVLE